MSNKRWLTKEDVINDLAIVTGRKVTNIDDKFAVRGECPPPVNVPDEEEDEFVQSHMQYISKDMSNAAPDLNGITHMLRMVNDYYGTATYDDNANIKELKKAANTVISISKLNPNVPEFIPQNVDTVTGTKNIYENDNSSISSGCLDLNESSSNNLNIKYKNIVYKNDNEIIKTDTSHQNETNNNDIDVTKKIDVSSLNSSDIKDIREKLKLKIVGTSKAECLNKKRERNLAMASLLKLYTDIPKSPQKNVPVKLMTPDYYQNLPEDVPSNHMEMETEQKLKKNEIKKEDIEEHIKHVSNAYDSTNVLFSGSKTASQENTDLFSNKTSDADIEKQNDLLMSKEIQESVKKVDKWLNGPEKKKYKSRAIFFGPVTFKRKETSSVKSSETQINSVSDNIERPCSAQTCDSFVPSAYAEELTKTYMERSQSQVVQNEDMWTKLERQLQEKDKVIREQMKSKQTQ